MAQSGMGTTVRLPPSLHAEVLQAAERLGISFNALVAVALVDYLAARPAVRMPTPQRGGNYLAARPAVQPKLSRAERRAAAKKSKRKGR